MNKLLSLEFAEISFTFALYFILSVFTKPSFRKLLK